PLGETWVSVAVTCRGLAALGVPRASLDKKFAAHWRAEASSPACAASCACWAHASACAYAADAG
ncbi:hypothetical protein ACWD4N_44885, partial [Streptomyces sp. NPDC002586]